MLLLRVHSGFLNLDMMLYLGDAGAYRKMIGLNMGIGSINFEFSSSPMSTFRVVANGVIGLGSEPIRQWSVLPLLFGQPFLHLQGLVRSHPI